MRFIRNAAAVLLTAALVAACQPSGAGAMADGNAAAASPTRHAPLIVKSASGTHRFEVEIALSDQERTQGLMNRRALDPDGGMLFLFMPPQIATFWMKDTLIPLDMLFIRADGTIAMIAAQAKPNSLETISAGVPVVAVLELAGGRAAQLGIREGDLVNWGGCVPPGGPQKMESAILDFCPGA